MDFNNSDISIQDFVSDESDIVSITGDEFNIIKNPDDKDFSTSLNKDTVMSNCD